MGRRAVLGPLMAVALARLGRCGAEVEGERKSRGGGEEVDRKGRRRGPGRRRCAAYWGGGGFFLKLFSYAGEFLIFFFTHPVDLDTRCPMSPGHAVFLLAGRYVEGVLWGF